MTQLTTRRRQMAPVVNSLWSPEVVTPPGLVPGNVASGTWPAADRALYVPFLAPDRFLVGCLFYGVGTTVGTTETFDIAILDATAQTVLLSLGSTTCSGGSASALRIVATAATWFAPGVYHLAMSMNNATTPTVQLVTLGAGGRLKTSGWLQAASQTPLANTPTLATIATDKFPLFGFGDGVVPL